MVKKIWQDEKYELEIGYSEEKQKIILMVTHQEDWQQCGFIDLDKFDVNELIEELKIWMDILESDKKI